MISHSLMVLFIITKCNSLTNLEPDFLQANSSSETSSTSEFLKNEISGKYAIFRVSDTFRVPVGVTRVRVCVVGGGSGGCSAHRGGGGSGYVQVGKFTIAPNQRIPIIIGKGGAGSENGSSEENARAGGESHFGPYLMARGGEGRYGSGVKNLKGGDGGSGGGGGMCFCIDAIQISGGNGGSDGSDGKKTIAIGTVRLEAGKGQGSFSDALKIFRHNKLTAGAGGQSGVSPKTEYTFGGGGGGGVLLNNRGPTGESGEKGAAAGGEGYGAGGGASYWNCNAGVFTGGGRGADGLVYVEWD